MSNYIPYVPAREMGMADPERTTQMVLQATYGLIMHNIKEALDSYVHDFAEHAIKEFGYDRNYPDMVPGSVPAIRDYLADLMDSPWVEEKAADIAGEGWPKADIETALRAILRASHARVDHAIRVTTPATHAWKEA